MAVLRQGKTSLQNNNELKYNYNEDKKMYPFN